MQTYLTSFPRASIWLSFYGFLLVGLGGGAGGVLLPSLGAFYHQGDAVLGTLFLVSALSNTISSVSCGPLAARLGLRCCWLWKRRLNDMEANANDALAGQPDAATANVQRGIREIHDELQLIATIGVSTRAGN